MFLMELRTLLLFITASIITVTISSYLQKSKAVIADMMAAVSISVTSVNFYDATGRNIPKDLKFFTDILCL
jgi:hypothetical protein